jgi:hypothetical protein
MQRIKSFDSINNGWFVNFICDGLFFKRDWAAKTT